LLVLFCGKIVRFFRENALFKLNELSIYGLVFFSWLTSPHPHHQRRLTDEWTSQDPLGDADTLATSSNALSIQIAEQQRTKTTAR